MGENQNKQRKTFTLRVTKAELLHLRDLFSILLPLEMKETVSHRLAHLQDRILVEAKLWQKVVVVCQEAQVPLDDDAPDFVVAASAAPPVSVFELAADSETDENGILEEAFLAPTTPAEADEVDEADEQ